MAPTQQTPREQADSAGENAAEIAVAAIAAAIVADATASQLTQVGLSPARLATEVAALYRPLITVRIYALRRRADAEFSDALPTDGPNVDQVQAFIEEELRWEETFVRRSARRIGKSLDDAVKRNVSDEELQRIYRKALDRERRFNMMRQQAANRRLTLRIEEAQVQAISPEGAYWLIDPALRTHTSDCLAMAGKLWSWEILRRIRPSNRHAQCGCRLLPAGVARANGLPSSDVVQTTLS